MRRSRRDRSPQILKLTVLGAAAAAVLACSAGAASATTLVFDAFEGYGPTSILNFTGFTNLIVSHGSVDFVHEPEFGLSTPTGVGMVDLDGSTNQGGTLQTAMFSANIGDVISFSFDASGNQRGGAADSYTWGFFTPTGLILNNVTATGGNINAGPIDLGSSLEVIASPSPLASDAAWSHYTLNFTAGSAGQFSAFVATGSTDNMGPLIDNFSLTSTGAVPEPASWALMFGGFGLAGAALRRRRAMVAA